MARVAFLSRGAFTSFKARDADALVALGYDVRRVRYDSWRDAAEVRRAVRDADVAFAWFADAHAAFATAFAPARVPVVVVVGGYEAAGVTSPRYGTWAAGGPLARAVVRHVFRRADVLLPVSEATRAGMLSHARPRGRVEVVPNGVDPARFVPGAKDGSVVTVGHFTDDAARIKGVRTFLDAARLVPEAPFVVAGPVRADAAPHFAGAPPNVRLVEEVTPDELAALYGRAKVYAQLSFHESFGVALAEAMAAGAVPVASRAGALPEVVGDAGYLVPAGDAKAAAEAIRSALAAPPEAGLRARRRIEERFTLALRAKRLDAILRETLEGKA